MLDLKPQYQQLKGKIDAEIAEIVSSQMFILGPKVEAFEKACAAYCGTAHALAVSSGSDALLLALMNEGIGEGAEVITTPYTFFATAGAIHRVGAKPVFVDIEPTTYNLDSAKIEAAITPRTRAIIPVHLYGQCANMPPILEIAHRHSLVVIEDACQSIGAQCNGLSAGSMGDYGCLSFYPSKNLSAFGDAGMVLSQDAGKAEKLVCMRNHGMAPRYYHKFVGGNFRMDALQAAVLNVKLPWLDTWTARRQANAARYDELLAGIPCLTLPQVAPWCTRHVRNQYIIRIAGGRRQQVWDGLKAAGIGCDVYYPLPLHLQECFAQLGYGKGDFPQSEAAAEETLAIPVYPDLTEEQLAYVADTLRRLLSQGRAG